MGMFDYIKFEYKLPIPSDFLELTVDDIQKSTFQTKSLGKNMKLYKVDVDGQLLEENREGEWIEGDKTAESIMDRIGYFKTTKEWFEPKNYTGVINFYELFRNDKHKNDYWYEANATFINGKMSEVKLTNCKVTDNTTRKTYEKQLEEEFRQRDEFLNKWYIKYTYVPYSRLIRWIFRKYHYLKTKLPPSYKIERFLTPW